MKLGRRTFLSTFTAVYAGMRAVLHAQRSSPEVIAAGQSARRFRPLSRPVEMPLADLSAPWRARQFVADATTPASAANPNRPLRIAGMVVRTATGSEPRPDDFCAVCVKCPHEQCDSDFVRDPKVLPAEVLQEIGKPVNDPVYLCPCHNSTFRAVDGERLAGPAPRGLYLFRVTSVTSTALTIGEVEEDALLFL